MAEPIAEQIVTKVEALLAAITGEVAPTGGTVNGASLTGVFRAPGLRDKDLEDNKGLGDPAILYFLCPDIENPVQSTWRTITSELPIDIVGAYRFTPSNDSVSEQPTLDRWQIQNRLARAVQDALRGDKTLTGSALYHDFEAVDLSPESTYMEGWALAMLRLVVTYSYTETAA